MRIDPIIAATTLAVFLLCGGCETYAPRPLDTGPKLATDIHALRNSDQLPVDLDKPLSVAAVAVLAVQNNPDLIAARTARGIADAQTLQAGILPNPQFNGSYGVLRAGPATVNGWAAGFSEDIRALITFSATRKAAQLGAKQTEADLLWQEWQVIGKARMLTVDYVKQHALLASVRDARQLMADRYERDRRAVEEGNQTLAAVAPDLAALGDIDKQLADAELKAQTGARDLDLLLGLDPAIQLVIDPAIAIPPVDPNAIDALVRDLPSRRPDLIALKLGYGAQDEKYFAAILGQFPALVFGPEAAKDTSAVRTFGPTVTMDLPIFDRNQGNIAIEKATREQLHAEYASRLSADVAEIHGLLADQLLLQRQLAATRVASAEADRAAKAAESAYAVSLIDARSYADVVGAALNRRQEVTAIEQNILDQQVALATLTGIAMPLADPLPDEAGVSR
jgi:outer membrane protein TolC